MEQDFGIPPYGDPGSRGWIEFPGYVDGMPIPRKPVKGD